SNVGSMKRIFLLTTTQLAFVLSGVTTSHGQQSSPAEIRRAVFAGGCFWCIQPAFDKAKGVIKTVVGYSGGTEPNPTYALVTSEKTRYRETIENNYDSAKISYDQLIDIYGREIDPTPAERKLT